MIIDALVEESVHWPELDLNVKFGIARVGKSYLLFVTDQADYDLGTIILTAPPQSYQLKPVATNYPLFGLQQNQLGSVLGKRAAMALKSPVLTLLLVKETRKPVELAKFLVKALGDILKQITDELTGGKKKS